MPKNLFPLKSSIFILFIYLFILRQGLAILSRDLELMIFLS
jgi:hypothetical protein